jgi:hypothetical protein
MGGIRLALVRKWRAIARIHEMMVSMTGVRLQGRATRSQSRVVLRI